MSMVVEEASNRTLLTTLMTITASAWALLALIVIGLSPDLLVPRLVFFTALAVALGGSCSLAAYALSFQLFSAKRHRGNLHRAIEHGSTTSLVVTATALLQLGRTLSPFNAMLLVGLFLVLQTIVLLRR